jgi:hypothetical protein
MDSYPAPRWKLRNLDAPQKLLVGVIVSTVLSGYLAALANVFAQHSEADGKSAVKLEEFLAVYKKDGLLPLVDKMQQSLGMDDVIRHYHGTGGGTALQAALDGSMKSVIEEKMVKDQGRSPESLKQAEALRQMLIEWSHLPEVRRKAAYDEGTPVTDDGVAIFDPKEKDGEKATVVKDTLQDYCVSCHKSGGTNQTAAGLPLVDYPSVVKYCVVDTGVSMKALALTTHVHLLGFSVLFAMTGFLFSLTEFPWLVRFVFVPFTLMAQLLEIACWWLAKVDVFYAKMIFYLGPLVGLGLFIQAAGVLFDLAIRRKERHV